MPCASLLVRIVQASCHPNGRPKQVREALLATCHFYFVCLGPVYTSPETFENRDLTLRKCQMFSVHTRSGEFENRGFTLKKYQMVSVHNLLRWKNLKTQTITGHFGFVYKKTLSLGKSLDYPNVIVFRELRFQNVFRPS